MVKKVALLVLALTVLVPVCGLAGYAIGHLIAIFLYSATLKPDTYELDRDLFAGVIGIMFIGGFLYVVSAIYAIYRFIRSVRKN
ncbi:hypothetical protein [Paracoccus onubensis]|uniref:Uncharacterized protein n=1 Tax=Paracoccus onubensis TaxID=1675788 RepID=A0A418T7Z0_9RHOB|nr:hypothetical protein [Paracoccus onubensis]RJE89322.1 hypothetical protein D3P04_01415 [Paracoccus onubensis]